jgi:hypothetical protein
LKPLLITLLKNILTIENRTIITGLRNH